MNNFDYQRAYYLYQKIRKSEEKIIEIYDSDVIKSPVHLSIGQEAIAVGVGMASNPQKDIIFSNYRGHAHYLAHGGDFQSFWSELYGKATGMSAGKAGSMHLGDMNINFMFTSAIVASAVPHAVGYALAIQMKNEDKRVICYHGEGATDEGCFWESINFAALKKLPILFICENNQYAIYSHQKMRNPMQNICERAQSFGLEAIKLQQRDTVSVFDATQQALAKISDISAPILLEIMTTRWMDHVGAGDDRHLPYRDHQELDNIIENDDLHQLRAKIGDKTADDLDAKIIAEIEDTNQKALQDDFPSAKALYEHVYA